jgi:exodeoxyribonuclease VII small subunit
MPQSKKSSPPKTFEERLHRLEEISTRMREGSCTLEEAAAFFEEGIRLAKSLEKDLSRIERKIEILVNTPNSPEESPELELFPDEEGNP